MDLWILTEEKPKEIVIKKIIEILNQDFNYDIFKEKKTISIIPEIENGVFKFFYRVNGLRGKIFTNIYIKIVSGNSSFLDYLIFLSDSLPKENEFSDLVFALEETKTSDKDSRNTSVYQRATKFVFASLVINKPMYMLYVDQEEIQKSSSTNNFGVRLLLSAGVRIINNNLNSKLTAFNNIEEIIYEKGLMRKPPKSNTPVNISKDDNTIKISARLDKPGNLGKASHDPNIGLVSIISFVLRKFGWEGEILITSHNLESNYFEKSENKLTIISSFLNIKFDKINAFKNKSFKPINYYRYDVTSEKNATILLHILLENSGWQLIYNNHAGGERGSFHYNDVSINIPKRNKSNKNINIPDIIMKKNNLIGIFEGKNKSNIKKGIKQLSEYDVIEEEYLKIYFKNFIVFRTLVVYDKTDSSNIDDFVSFILYKNGEIIYSKQKFNNLL